MTLQEIKKAVNEGKVVHWKNEGYQVIKSKDDYLIKFLGKMHSSFIGLTWQDGVTMNGEEKDFFIKNTYNHDTKD